MTFKWAPQKANDMSLKTNESFVPRVKTEISEIQHIQRTRDFRALSTDAEKVRFLNNLGFGPTAIINTTNLKKGNVKRYLGNPEATSVRGKTYLNSEEEELLVSIILTREQDHEALDRQQIANKAFEIGLKRDLPHRPQHQPSRTWVCKFLKRHEEPLKELVSRKIETKRTEACSKVAIASYFEDVVGPMMKEHQFKPQNMWNFDETMLGYNNRKRRVVVSRSSRSVTETVPDTIKDHTTMEFCISASGEMMKPAVINKKKFLDRSLDFLVMEENWHFCSKKVAGCPKKVSKGGWRTSSYHTLTKRPGNLTNRCFLWSMVMDHENKGQLWNYSRQTTSMSS